MGLLAVQWERVGRGQKVAVEGGAPGLAVAIVAARIRGQCWASGKFCSGKGSPRPSMASCNWWVLGGDRSRWQAGPADKTPSAASPGKASPPRVAACWASEHGLLTSRQEARKVAPHTLDHPDEDSVIVEVNINYPAKTGTPGTPSADDLGADFTTSTESASWDAISFL